MNKEQGVIRRAQFLREIDGDLQRQHEHHRRQPEAEVNGFAPSVLGQAVTQAPGSAQDQQNLDHIHGPVGQGQGAFNKKPAIDIVRMEAAQSLHQLRESEGGVSHSAGSLLFADDLADISTGLPVPQPLGVVGRQRLVHAVVPGQL